MSETLEDDLDTHRSARTWPYPRYNDFSRLSIRLPPNGSWRGVMKPTQNTHIFSPTGKDWPLNIILPEVSDFIQARSTRRNEEGDIFPLHKYIHHGLSSQALLFNLVGPLLVRGDLTPLQKVLVRKGVEWPGDGADAILEFEDREVFNEVRGQPTSIDLVVKSREGVPHLFIEAKFTEREFGGCSVYQQGDCDGRNPAADLELCYLHHIGRRYWSIMHEYGLAHGQIGADTMCILAPHYQFFRELLFAVSKGGTFILLSDDRSPVFYCDGPQGERGLMPFLLGLLPQEIRSKVTAISIQELVEEIRVSGRHDDWIDDFYLKYGLHKPDDLDP